MPVGKSCKWLVSAALVLAMVPGCAGKSNVPVGIPSTTPFIRGADLSYLNRVESSDGTFSVNGEPEDPLAILRGQGITHVRLRLWVRPDGPYSNLREVLTQAKRLDAAGLQWILAFHFSDDWADAQTQVKPMDWANMSFYALQAKVRAYTAEVMQLLEQQQTLPDLVQLGNEITHGMLWPEGRVGGRYDTPQQWGQFTELLKSAAGGVRKGSKQHIPLMLHVENGTDNEACRWFFDNMKDRKVRFDVIGVSYFPWWHGTLADLRDNLLDLAMRYRMDIVLVETAYPWTLDGYDDERNIVNHPDHLHPGFAATPEGQQAYMTTLLNLMRNLPEKRGRGVVYWAPDWISTEFFPSTWENLTLFDASGDLLPAARVLGKGP